MDFATYQIGTLVKVNASFMDEPEGVISYVYEHYTGGGISLITQNGVDLGGFSPKEQSMYLEYWRDTGRVYHFKNVIQLAYDWRSGIFKPLFADLTPHEVKFRKGI